MFDELKVGICIMSEFGIHSTGEKEGLRGETSLDFGKCVQVKRGKKECGHFSVSASSGGSVLLVFQGELSLPSPCFALS